MVREDIFKRIRAPVKKGDAENQALRDTQANMYYMPRLGGDDGKSTSPFSTRRIIVDIRTRRYA